MNSSFHGFGCTLEITNHVVSHRGRSLQCRRPWDYLKHINQLYYLDERLLRLHARTRTKLTDGFNVWQTIAPPTHLKVMLVFCWHGILSITANVHDRGIYSGV